jgi:hypothetical protein
MGDGMHQSRDSRERLWQGMVAALLLSLVLFSEAIIGTEPEPPATVAAVTCDACLGSVGAGAPAWQKATPN